MAVIPRPTEGRRQEAKKRGKEEPAPDRGLQGENPAMDPVRRARVEKRRRKSANRRARMLKRAVERFPWAAGSGVVEEEEEEGGDVEDEEMEDGE